MSWRGLLIGGLLTALLNGPAHAHSRSESYSNWRIAGATVTGTVTVTAGEVMALIPLDNARPLDEVFAQHLRETVTVLAGDEPCRGDAQSLQAARGFVRVELSFSCTQAEPLELRYRALFAARPEHVHFARFFSAGALLGETVFTDRADDWVSTSAAAERHSLSDFFDLGVRHIASGIDHIAFLLGLLLVAGTFGRSVAAITGFTLGHSLSLSAAVLGYVRADGRLVEAFIGFTVALVAIEFFDRQRGGRSGLALAAAAAAWATAGIALALGVMPIPALATYLGFGLFAYCYLNASAGSSAGARGWSGLIVATTCFGLIHGFGFAGFLMDTGIDGASLAIPLLGFNLGVEAGQLALLAAFYVVGRILGAGRVARLAPALASALCAVGVYWFVGRSLAL